MKAHIVVTRDGRYIPDKYFKYILQPHASYVYTSFSEEDMEFSARLIEHMEQKYDVHVKLKYE